jgi:hypothetical protein
MSKSSAHADTQKYFDLDINTQCVYSPDKWKKQKKLLWFGVIDAACG